MFMENNDFLGELPITHSPGKSQFAIGILFVKVQTQERG